MNILLLPPPRPRRSPQEITFEALQRWISHFGFCGINHGLPCDCGLEMALRNLGVPE